jgi:hypothetical protein
MIMGTRKLLFDERQWVALFTGVSLLAALAAGCADDAPTDPPPDGPRVLVSEAIRLEPGAVRNVVLLDVKASVTIRFSVTDAAKQPSGIAIRTATHATAWTDIADYSPYEDEMTVTPGEYRIDVGCRDEATASCAFDLMVWLR